MAWHPNRRERTVIGNRMRMTAAGKMLVNIVAVGALAAASFVAASTVAAQPPPLPADPVVPAPPPEPGGPPVPLLGTPLGSNGLSPVAQNGSPATGPFGLPQVPLNELLLGQNPVPTAPGGPPGPPPNLNPFNNGYLLPQNEMPSAPGEGQIFDVPPGQQNADISGVDVLKRVWHLYQDDRLTGALLGQVPPEQLGAPLPGMAPLPGTNIPPGLAAPGPPPPVAVPPA